LLLRYGGKYSADNLTLEENYIRRVVGKSDFYVMNPESAMFIDKGICVKCFADKVKSKALSLLDKQSPDEILYNNDIQAEKPLNFD